MKITLSAKAVDPNDGHELASKEFKLNWPDDCDLPPIGFTFSNSSNDQPRSEQAVIGLPRKLLFPNSPSNEMMGFTVEQITRQYSVDNLGQNVTCTGAYVIAVWGKPIR